MKKIITISFLLCFSFAKAQPPQIVWQNCYSAYNLSVDGGIICDAATGYLVALLSPDPGLPNCHGNGDIWLISMDHNGNKLWENCYGGSNHDWPLKCLRKGNHNYVLGITLSNDGDVQSNHQGKADIWVFKINSEGELLWEKCFGSQHYDEARDMVFTPDGGFALLARTEGKGGDIGQYYGWFDVWVCKCDSLGNIEWETTLGNEDLDNGNYLLVNRAGNLMMAGAASHYGGVVDCKVSDYLGDVWIVELDMKTGAIVWQQCYGGKYYDVGVMIEEDDDSYVVAAGSYSNDGDVSGHHGGTGEPPYGSSDFWLFRINKEGTLLWQNSFGGNYDDFPSYITITEDGGIVAMGTTLSKEGDVSGNHSHPQLIIPSADVWAIKLDAMGNIIWQQCYGGLYSEVFGHSHEVYKKGDGNYVIGVDADLRGKGDIECETALNSNGVWVFEVKDCAGAPATLAGPGRPEGPVSVHSAISLFSYYNINNDPQADYYEWEISPADAGEALCFNDQGRVKWNPCYTGVASVRARAINLCGVTGPWGEPLDISVYAKLYLPHVPVLPQGPQYILLNITMYSDYTCSKIVMSEETQWLLEPENAGWISYTDTTAQVLWHPYFQGTAQIRIRGINSACGPGPWSAPLKISVNITGVDEAGMAGIQLYPNPTPGPLTLLLPPPGPYSITIADLSGRVLSYTEAHSGIIQHDVSGLGAGAYLVLVSGRNGAAERWKLVVVK